MKKYLTLFATILVSIVAFAQQDTISYQEDVFQFDTLICKKGKITKIVDYNVTPKLSTIFNKFETCVRKVMRGNDTIYYYRIERPKIKKEGHIQEAVVVLIEYSELVEINKVIEKLLSEFEWDKVEKTDYLQNQYVNKDGIAIGYYIERRRHQWFLDLDVYNPLQEDLFQTRGYFSLDALIANFKRAQAKIEELKSIVYVW